MSGTATISFAPFFVPVRLYSRSTGPVSILFPEDVSTVLNPVQDETQVLRVLYGYQVTDRAGHEILSYHWHPSGVSAVRHPHLHLSSRVRPVTIEPVGTTIPIADMHLPTGFVSLADVVRLLIEEFGVQPRRPDWQDVLVR